MLIFIWLKLQIQNLSAVFQKLKAPCVDVDSEKSQAFKAHDEVEVQKFKKFNLSMERPDFGTPLTEFKASDFLNLRYYEISEKLGVEYPEEYADFDFGRHIVTWIDNNSILECYFDNCRCIDVEIWLKQSDGQFIIVDEVHVSLKSL
ncbi:hypothetical protein [Candidatus Schmidhempelia bombi]|uniref:Uncharacterized protein n=1 Tax=Candidatus Schmidhempelia bombi str. Bimp TaxID=1387197 RepID=A0AB94IAY4_9GAMM|nr:hypothetical protein [Candidatus Schmidhempelia bombi]TEA26565.1 hypothetical protein O970_08145 [Candidatus Schmidhempelia bombi str. Bimp]